MGTLHRLFDFKTKSVTVLGLVWCIKGQAVVNLPGKESGGGTELLGQLGAACDARAHWPHLVLWRLQCRVGFSAKGKYLHFFFSYRVK